MKSLRFLMASGLLVFLCQGCDFTQKYCESAVDCVGSDVMTVEQCVEDSDTAATDADDAGCGDQYDDLAKCSYKESECTTEESNGVSYDTYTAGDACSTETDAYTSCMYPE